MKRFLVLLLTLLAMSATALADVWHGTAEELANLFTEAGYPLSQLTVERESRVTFEGGAIEVYSSVEDCEAAREGLSYGDAAGFRQSNVLLIRYGPEVTSQHSAALTALLGGESPEVYDEVLAAQERSLEGMVWIPVHGGRKYHRRSGCSSMIDPEYVTLQVAVFLGFDACGLCY